MTIGLVGCGIWGQLILKELLNLKVKVQLYEPDLHLRKELLEIVHDCTLVPQLSSLKYTQGIIVASPSSTHYEILKEILPWKIPLFIEKPLTTSLSDALDLRKILHHQAFLMHIWRYHRGIQMLGQIARTGTIGQITALYTHRCNWTSPRRDTDCVWNLAPHDLTIALEILGYIPTPKSVVVERHQDIIRSMTAMLGDAPFVQIEVSNRYADKRREVRLHGTEGIAILADERVDFIEIYHGNDQTYPTPSSHQRCYFENTPPLRLEITAFVDFLRGGSPPLSSFEEGIQTVEILHQLTQLATA